MEQDSSDVARLYLGERPKFKAGAYNTRNGMGAVIYSTQGCPDRPLIGASFTGEYWVPRSWKWNGLYRSLGNHSPLDLLSPIRTVWLIWGRDCMYITQDKARAREFEQKGYKIVEIEEPKF